MCWIGFCAWIFRVCYGLIIITLLLGSALSFWMIFGIRGWIVSSLLFTTFNTKTVMAKSDRFCPYCKFLSIVIRTLNFFLVIKLSNSPFFLLPQPISTTVFTSCGRSNGFRYFVKFSSNSTFIGNCFFCRNFNHSDCMFF